MGLRDIYVALIYVSFFMVGLTAPFIFTIGYMWVDIFNPQLLSAPLESFQVSMAIAVPAIVGYFLVDRKSPPRITAHTMLTIVFALWCTLSLSWAVVPGPAWSKWDWAFKSLMFSAFLPFVIRTRIHIETFLQVFLFAMCLHMMPLGIKNLLSGSGYGRELGIVAGNSLLLESSTLAAVSVSIIPIILFLRKHTTIIARSRITDALYYALVGVAILCAIGTYARTAVVGFVVVGAFLWFQSRSKLLFSAIAVVMVLGVGYTVSKSWTARIDTTTEYNQDDSALGRILVWKWTLGFVASNPLGGGFNSFYIDNIEFPAQDGQPATIVHGKAFHNLFIEILGEQGFPGLAMFLAIEFLSFNYLRRIRRRTRDRPYMAWCHDLAGALMASLATLLACGNFIGIGYQSIVWYATALPVCLYGYVLQVERLEAKARLGSAQTAAGGLNLSALPRPAR
jgi:probable O-glycosylation ligase (exosortase A-associated)